MSENNVGKRTSLNSCPLSTADLQLLT